jgi:hypothetical protein
MARGRHIRLKVASLRLFAAGLAERGLDVVTFQFLYKPTQGRKNP